MPTAVAETSPARIPVQYSIAMIQRIQFGRFVVGWPRFAGSYCSAARSSDDLRVTFAVHSLQRLTENAIDVNAYLYYLQTYMGHASLRETQDYLCCVYTGLTCLANSRNDTIPARRRLRVLADTPLSSSYFGERIKIPYRLSYQPKRNAYP